MVGWTLALWALASVPTYLSNLTQSTSNVIAAIAVVLVAVIIVVTIVLVVRLAILFPTIAVDAPGGTVGNMLADTKGRTWLILKTYLIVLLPLLALVIVGGLISDAIGLPDRLGTIRDSSFEFVATVAFAVAQSRLFDWIGHQVKGQPAGSAQLATQPPPVG